MSTSEPAVAEAMERPHSWNERSISLGPGLLRLPDGTYRRPLEAAFHVRCTGPLAYWDVSVKLDVSHLPSGEERLLFLYPLPPQASISQCRVFLGDLAIGPEPRVRAVEELEEAQQPPLPSKSMLNTFGGESLPILSMALEKCLPACGEDGTPQVRLTFGNGLPTIDGRIQVSIPARVDPSLEASGATSLRVHVEIEDGNELVDEPVCSDPLERHQTDEILHLKGDSFQALERDIEVSFRPGRTEMPVTRLRRSADNFLFSIFPPTSIPASPQRRDLVFCVDASENVDNGLFDMIKDDLSATLRGLDENDRFALVTYGRDIDGYQGGEFCDIVMIDEAISWLDTVEPKGRADIQPLLARIQSLPSQPDRQVCIFLLAAGHVGNEPSILKSLDFDQSDRRYYAVGIGPSVQQAFLRRLALLARGRCEVAPQGHCADALARLLSQTRALLAEVTFEEQDGREVDFDLESLVPSRMGSLTPEGPVHCLGKGSPSSLRFRSKDETGVFFAGTVNARNTDNPAMSGVWAGMRVREMLDSVRLSTGARRKQLRSETSALAREHGILVEDTVLVLESENGIDVQLSALPYRWRRGGQPTVAKAEEEATPAFDWRKGLKARDGLFKGARPGGDDSSGEGVRAGLRRPGEMKAASKSGRDQGKPMLDRYGMSQVHSSPDPEDLADEEILDSGEHEIPSEEPSGEPSDERAEESSEDSAEQAAEESAETEVEGSDQESSEQDAPEPPAEPASADQESESEESAKVESVEPVSETAAAPSVPPAPTVPSSDPVSAEPSPASPSPSPAPLAAVPVHAVSVPSATEPVFQYIHDPLAEGRVRMEAYLEQAASVETRMALASLAALPAEVAGTGPNLPRILAQTVGHLEKNGYYSAAVSVLGLLLRDYSSPEVLKKMESLLVAWAASLNEEHVPESIHILQAGLRVCPGSEGLQRALESHCGRWGELTRQQCELPEVAGGWKPVDPPSESLLSQSQLELARLQQKHDQLVGEMASFRASVEQQLAALPALLENLLDSRPAVVSPAPPVPAVAPAVAEPAPAVASAEAEPVPTAAPVSAVRETVTVEVSQPVALPEDDLGLPEIPVPPMEQPVATASPDVSVSEAASGDPATDIDALLNLPPLETAEPTQPPAAEALVEQPQQTVVSAPQGEASAPPPGGEEGSGAIGSPSQQEVSAADLSPPSAEVEAPVPEPTPGEPAAPEPAEESGETLNLTRDELLELLQAEPKDESGHRAVKTAMPDAKDRINFYRDLVRIDATQIYHSLSLARAYREADQTKVAVVHYQKYLRTEKDAPAYLELADAYDELGKSNLSVSARKAAELMA